ncbi:hypothetical protein LEP1GSC047_2371 [Leptospira inadai serovar Lyme str. 10]|uniref:DUF4258 domain-containing protein n=2 Tax=Leptospira inadai serovar Lyme TaxID=293084 RepID=V6HPD5_9LEPT|nr:hypothetical protein [Leptospira inadai]EQA38745.1 hypothetical protein LEP1GSC047_2371 [Leptospira inadai serovar Lyme str. 10]PNV76201.1 hypothetical protein BES34_004125 [Leptospira inadai serovar Lyme]
MNLVEDVFKRNIRITLERRRHFEEDHPEMFGQGEKIAECLSQPDQVRISKADSSVELFYKLFEATPVGRKYLCAVIKNHGDDLFLVTAYFTDKVKEGAVLYG